MRMEEENSREAAEKLQQIGSSILGAARDELYLGIRPDYEVMEQALIEKFGGIG